MQIISVEVLIQNALLVTILTLPYFNFISDNDLTIAH